MAKAWVLDTDTKGTGANMVPLEEIERKPDAVAPGRKPADRPAEVRERRPRPNPAAPVHKTATALPPGHVRKTATGELGRVKSVDAKAGTATVQWLRSGTSSTVPLSSISRR